jgi:hypothetical protein
MIKKVIGFFNSILDWLDGKKTAIGATCFLIVTFSSQAGIPIPPACLEIIKYVGEFFTSAGLAHKSVKKAAADSLKKFLEQQELKTSTTPQA